jgi:hypothetical protein
MNRFADFRCADMQIKMMSQSETRTFEIEKSYA